MTWSTLTAALRPSIRAALAASLAVVVAQLLGLRYPLYAMIAAVIVTGLSALRTRRLALQRLVRTVLGTGLGAVIDQSLPTGVWAALGVLIAMSSSYLLRLNEAAKLAGYVCGIVVLEHGDEAGTYALHRVMETILGMAFAVLVSLVPPLIRIDEPNQEDS
jgi:uncharacterized membrane protein YgaE (UPF0421/DUF939 family)